jgi:hypothetical protein
MAFALRLRFSARFVSMINILEQLIIVHLQENLKKINKKNILNSAFLIFNLFSLGSAIKLFSLAFVFKTFRRATRATLKLSQVSSRFASPKIRMKAFFRSLFSPFSLDKTTFAYYKISVFMFIEKEIFLILLKSHRLRFASDIKVDEMFSCSPIPFHFASSFNKTINEGRRKMRRGLRTAYHNSSSG